MRFSQSYDPLGRPSCKCVLLENSCKCVLLEKMNTLTNHP